MQQHTKTIPGVETEPWLQQALAVIWLTASVLNGRVAEDVEMGDKKDKSGGFTRANDAKVSIPQNPMPSIT